MNTPHVEQHHSPPQSAGPTKTVCLAWDSGRLTGPLIQQSRKTLGELSGLFHDSDAFARMNPATLAYSVRWLQAVPAGTEGGLLWGVTLLQPGKVGDEFFMTHGHFHADCTRAEYYATTSGCGLLLRMDKDRKTWAEEMSPGSLHYIDGRHAHRVANTGDEPLIFWACWGSDAGYDYGTIRENGFGMRVVERDGKPVLVAND